MVRDAPSRLSDCRSVEDHRARREVPDRASVRRVARARHYGNLTYQAVRDILRRGLDFEPLPNTQTSTWSTAPRFARDVRELVASRLDQNGGKHGIH
jgi:hypothetical protein